MYTRTTIPLASVAGVAENVGTYPQISLLVLPLGSVQASVGSHHLASSTRSCRLLTPSNSPSSKTILSFPRPTCLAARNATFKQAGKVNNTFVPAVLSACTISSTPYEGLAPFTQPPARTVAHIATGYQIVLVEKSETASPGCRPYERTRTVLKAVAKDLASSKSRRSPVLALTYAPSCCCFDRLNRGE